MPFLILKLWPVSQLTRFDGTFVENNHLLQNVVDFNRLKKFYMRFILKTIGILYNITIKITIDSELNCSENVLLHRKTCGTSIYLQLATNNTRLPPRSICAQPHIRGYLIKESQVKLAGRHDEYFGLETIQKWNLSRQADSLAAEN